MDLILWRHAEADAAGDGQDDLARPLSTKGERQARRMGAWLHEHLPKSTRILVSPARRTQQTAQGLGRPFKTVPALSPEVSPMAALSAARWPDSAEPVVLVGHQPTLGQLAALLLAETPQPWVVKKGAVWWLRQRTRSGVSQVVLQGVWTPDWV